MKMLSWAMDVLIHPHRLEWIVNTENPDCGAVIGSASISALVGNGLFELHAEFADPVHQRIIHIIFLIGT